MQRTSIFTAAVVAGFALLPVSGTAQTMQFGHVGNPGSLFEATANHFAECVNDASDGSFEVQTFGSSQLGTDTELLQKLRLGQVTFALPSSVMSSVDDIFGVFEMPYLIKDRDHMRRVQAELMDIFHEAAARHGYRIVGLAENGFRHITNNTRPITVPDDLQGIRLRTPSGSWRVKMFRQYGANPTPMAFSDVFIALQTGVIDGQENPFTQIASARFQEVQRYISLTNHVYTPAFILASERHFSALPEAVQATLTDCATETQSFTYETAERMEVELLDVITSAGVEVNEADIPAFIEASRPIYEEFAEEVDGGGPLVEAILALGDTD